MWVGDAFARPVRRRSKRIPAVGLSGLRTIMSSRVVFSAEVKQQILRHLPDVVIADIFGSRDDVARPLAYVQGEKTATASFRRRTKLA
jgi:fatty-acyl-CoA synthase